MVIFITMYLRISYFTSVYIAMNLLQQQQKFSVH